MTCIKNMIGNIMCKNIREFKNKNIPVDQEFLSKFILLIKIVII